MSRSLLEDAFAHHVWATLQLLDACVALRPEQLESAVPGTYGSILQTARHLVNSDSWDLFVATGDRSLLIDADNLDLPALRAAMDSNRAAWFRVIEQSPDPDAVLYEVDDNDGFERQLPMGIQLAQALNHGTDHRSQICTALTALGVSPPAIDPLAYGRQDGRVVEKSPAS